MMWASHVIWDAKERDGPGLHGLHAKDDCAGRHLAGNPKLSWAPLFCLDFDLFALNWDPLSLLAWMFSALLNCPWGLDNSVFGTIETWWRSDDFLKQSSARVVPYLRSSDFHIHKVCGSAEIHCSARFSSESCSIPHSSAGHDNPGDYDLAAEE